MNEAHRFSYYGPGGRKCSCCGPSPTYRKRFDRTVKRRAKQFVKREIKKIVDYDNVPSE